MGDLRIGEVRHDCCLGRQRAPSVAVVEERQDRRGGVDDNQRALRAAWSLRDDALRGHLEVCKLTEQCEIVRTA